MNMTGSFFRSSVFKERLISLSLPLEEGKPLSRRQELSYHALQFLSTAFLIYFVERFAPLFVVLRTNSILACFRSRVNTFLFTEEKSVPPKRRAWISAYFPSGETEQTPLWRFIFQ